ncbi:hypothetical protein JW926_08165 [Candidatus Sumerlaeota bacterium]|nr:hypothetical protein [Candidatus Sumerlaeota bacterium]
MKSFPLKKIFSLIAPVIIMMSFSPDISSKETPVKFAGIILPGEQNPPSSKVEEISPVEEIRIDGIPFQKGNLWSEFREGEPLEIKTNGVRAHTVNILGGVNSPDQANPPWGGGNSYHNFFIGDKAGDIRLEYQSGKVSEIPLIFGYAIWWKNPLASDPEPFKSDPEARNLLDRTLSVINGLDPISGKEPRGSYLRISLSDEPLLKIIFKDNPEKEGHLLIEGITFENVSHLPKSEYDNWKVLEGEDVPDEIYRSLEERTIDSMNPFPREKAEGVRKLGRLLYIYPEDIEEETISRTRADVTRENFSGPMVSFQGAPEATLFTNIYYENAQGIVERIEETGMTHESAYKADYYGGFGTWRPALGAFWDASYTRIRSLILLTEMGYMDKVEKSLDFFGHWIMHFPRSFPQVQMNGKPVPGHAAVIANKPHVYFDELKNVGWPTRYATRDFGNPENDGHGMLMLSFYRQWLKKGKSEEWARHHWDVIHEMAEYIPWALDNPSLSFSEHGLLYSESEGGMQIQSIYCDMPCYLGLKGFAEMARAIGNENKAARWEQYAEKMSEAMERYYPRTIEPWGDVWDPKKTGGWAGEHSVLAPLLFITDFRGYNGLNHLPEKWKERAERTYRMQLTRNQPEWRCPAGLGYGQCYITESALLLDRMNDAEQMLNWLARFCFSPRQKHPYRVPEGITMASDGSVWRRWGDLGNLYQLGEVVYTIRIMLGIDDTDSANLRIMPRLPFSWKGVHVDRHPVMTKSNQKSELVFINYKLESDREKDAMFFLLDADKFIDACAIRLGPFAKQKKKADVTINGKNKILDMFQSGDASWVWIQSKDGKSGKIEIQIKIL